MIAKIIRFACIALLLQSTAARAEIYSCKDAAGRTVTSDRPMPECADRPMRIIGNSGIVKREIAAPLTAEQKRQRQLQVEEEKKIAAARETQIKQDQAMLLRYSSESDIESARRREVTQLQERIAKEKSQVAENEKRLHAAQLELKQANGKPSEALQSKLAAAEQALQNGKAAIEQFDVTMLAVNARYDTTVRRYRQITEAGWSASAASN